MSLERISKQRLFLQKVRSALGRTAAGSANFHDLFPCDGKKSALLLERIRNRHAADRKRLLDRLICEGGPLNLKVIPVPDAADAAQAIVELALNRAPEWSDARSLVAWRHPLIDGLNLPDRLKEHGIPVYVPDPGPADPVIFRLQAQTALIGVTSADHCIAESASLVLKTRSGQPRMVSLLPSIHVAVITEDQILESLAECYALVQLEKDAGMEGMSCCMTLISGPSKTADIEAVMVHGAHGPREMIIYVIHLNTGYI